MIETVAELIANKEKRLAQGRRGAEYVTQFHSPKSIVELYEQIFGNLTRVEGPPAPRALAPNRSTKPGDSSR
jgi:hypothetical protein